MIQESVFSDHGPRGAYRDLLLGPGGEVVWERPWQPNLIVAGLRSVIAALLKGGSPPDPAARPLGFWAVGEGEEAWDRGVIPDEAARRELRALRAETARKATAPGQILFLPSGTLSNQLQIDAEFTFADLPAGRPSLREFGLVAGPATAALGSGLLINHIIHPRIDMQPGFTLQRSLRLTF